MFNQVLCDDLYRYEGDKSKKTWIKMRYLFCVPGFTYTFFLRHVALSQSKMAKVLWSFPLHLTKIITHIQIPPQTQIGNGFRIVHFGQIVVNPGASIGKNFNITPGCLIGSSQGKHAGTPTIGDNVCMQTNSIIVGGCHIGDNVLIAPGAFVNFDVPSNSIVIGNPGKIIPRDASPTDKYIVYPVRNK